jgi:hypothetical protein
MGESKRRKEVMGEKYGSSEPVASWIPFLTKDKAAKFVEVSTQAAWYGIGGMVVIWVTIRFVGPAFGWWHLAD